MAYATKSDVKSALGGYMPCDDATCDRLLERASIIIDGELAYSGVDVDDLNEDLLMECCCMMVEEVLDKGVGMDYGTEIDTSVLGSKKMGVPSRFRTLLGLKWKRATAGVCEFA